MTLAEIRLAAADLLESRPDAWCQGAYSRLLPSGQYAYCMLGACREVAGDCQAAEDAADATFADLIHTRKALGARSWNDKPGRTREQVIAALRDTKKPVDLQKKKG